MVIIDTKCSCRYGGQHGCIVAPKSTSLFLLMSSIIFSLAGCWPATKATKITSYNDCHNPDGGSPLYLSCYQGKDLATLIVLSYHYSISRIEPFTVRYYLQPCEWFIIHSTLFSCWWVKQKKSQPFCNSYRF